MDSTSPILCLPAELRQQILSYVAEDVLPTSDGEVVRLLNPNVFLICTMLFHDAMELTQVQLPKNVNDTFFRLDDINSNPFESLAQIIITYKRLVRTSHRKSFSGVNLEFAFWEKSHRKRPRPDLTRLFVDPEEVYKVFVTLMEPSMRWSRTIGRKRKFCFRLRTYCRNLRVSLDSPDLPLSSTEVTLTCYWRGVGYSLFQEQIGAMRFFKQLQPDKDIQVVGRTTVQLADGVKEAFNKSRNLLIVNDVVITPGEGGYLNFSFKVQ